MHSMPKTFHNRGECLSPLSRYRVPGSLSFLSSDDNNISESDWKRCYRIFSRPSIVYIKVLYPMFQALRDSRSKQLRTRKIRAALSSQPFETSEPRFPNSCSTKLRPMDKAGKCPASVVGMKCPVVERKRDTLLKGSSSGWRDHRCE